MFRYWLRCCFVALCFLVYAALGLGLVAGTAMSIETERYMLAVFIAFGGGSALFGTMGYCVTRFLV